MNFLPIKISIVKLTLIFILVIQLLVIFNIKPWKNANQKNALINWDVTSYYSYLPALFIHQDLKFNFLEKSKINYEAKHQFWPETAPNGNKVIKTTMGMSILYLPFFLIAHSYSIIDRSVDASGFTYPYEVGLTFSSVFYLFIGLFFLSKVLNTLFTDFKTSILLVVLFLGSNLFYYSTTELCMSHAYTFSLASLLMFCTVKMYQKISWGNSVLFGIILGFLFLIRPTNILWALILLLYKIDDFSGFNARLIWLKKNIKYLLSTMIVGLLICSLQFIYWKWATGNWLFNSYVGETFYFSKPKILEFLFSYRKGWLLYSPIFILSFLGLFNMYKTKNPWLFSTVIIFPITIYLFASWWCWWFGGGFGMRSMIDYYPLLIIPVGHILSLNFPYKKTILTVVLLSFTSLNLFQTLQKRKGVIHWDSMTKEAYWEFFFTPKMNTSSDWDKQKKILKTPNYDKARKGEKEYNFRIL